MRGTILAGLNFSSQKRLKEKQVEFSSHSSPLLHRIFDGGGGSTKLLPALNVALM